MLLKLHVINFLTFQHPKYRKLLLPNKAGYSINDIALLSLKTPVPLSKQIQRICLPFDQRDYAGIKLTASGWGYTNEAVKVQPAKLKVVVLTGSDSVACQKRIALGGKVAINPQIHLCAGFGEGKGTYNGDSGGEMKINFVGMTRFNDLH